MKSVEILESYLRDTYVLLIFTKICSTTKFKMSTDKKRKD